MHDVPLGNFHWPLHFKGMIHSDHLHSTLCPLENKGITDVLVFFFLRERENILALFFSFFFLELPGFLCQRQQAACVSRAAIVTLQFQGRTLKSHLKHV